FGTSRAYQASKRNHGNGWVIVVIKQGTSGVKGGGPEFPRRPRSLFLIPLTDDTFIFLLKWKVKRRNNPIISIILY
ncbi:MAG: hypothetical protein JXA22_08750, partial [Candidatus Thermoplasmatota archaeon]|nr:hypothetical protein [Candidatus Thermoplasmatota archaeon]